MKKRIPTLLILLILFFSCSKDDNSLTEPDQEENTEIPEQLIIATETCLYADLIIEANSTVKINCLLDLEGKTIEVPEGVTFEFDGGDIFNGTLNFATSGKIAGEILNSKLTVEGDVQLTSEIFNFYPSRWNADIIQGITTKDIALQNNQNLENLFYWTKELGASTFRIDVFDAYFEVTTVTSTTTNQNFYPSLESVNVPSDFNLVMTNNTHLRIFPYSSESAGNGTLLGIREVENVMISGGNLHGDRYEYYLTDDNEEGNKLLTIRSGKNINIDNVYFENSSVYAATINSVGFSFNDDYNPSENITIKNSTFYNNRAMSIAITDGRNLTIENNTFIDSSQPTTYSDGGAVGYAINIEPVRSRDDDGNLVEYQKVFDVTIKDNKETNSRNGFLILFVGQDIIVENNEIDTRMAWNLMSGVRIRNNTFDATNSWASESWAFSAGGIGETVFDNEFSGNIIKGYSLGINVGSINSNIFDNEITDVSSGIQINDAHNSSITKNTIIAEDRGIYIGNTSADGIEIKENNVTAGAHQLNISATNEDEEYSEYSILIDDNKFYGDGVISLFRANGITFSNNEVNAGIRIAGDVSNSIINGNIVFPFNSHGIYIYNNHENLTISNNTTYKLSNYECFLNDSNTPNEITLSNNTCN